MSDAKADAKAIFLEALECKGALEVMRFLDQACGADAVLRGRVEELLRAHQDAGAFLGGAGQEDTTRDRSIAERPGTIIGPYKLLEQIGEGGFGVVFMAEQMQPVRRKVALKVLKPGMDTRQVVARFEAERQALAIMDHPHIAKVLDGGATETGRPYFVMELVRGVPITEFCDQNLLTPRQRLELFIPVCQAIQHAHQKGIIHRDLKPSNVLVSRHDTTPVVKVIDFGVAKALGQVLTDKTLFTGIAQMIGTPLYMSPEQAGMSDLDIDTRSDIYSLGVLLYELLTGTTPFDKGRFTQAAQDDIRRIIREEEPPRPSTRLSDSKETLASISALRGMEPAKLTKLVRGELDWIVMKALEKDRNRRYETANSIAADIERYLKDEPVQACPPSAGYRIRKFVSRNRAPLFTIAAIGLATLVLFAAMAWTAWERHSRSIQRVNEKSARAAVLSARLPDILSDITSLEEQQAWSEALSAARRAETAVEVGEGDAEITATVRGHVAELQFVERIEAARSMRDVDAGISNFDEMVGVLAPGVARAGPLDGGPSNLEGIERAYNEAFAAFGVDVKNPSTAAASTRLRQAPGILQAVAAALDDWAAVRRDRSDPGARHLSELALAIDDDPFRREIRQAILSQNVETLRRLAKETLKTPQPAATLALLAIAQSTTDERALLLMHAQIEYPADFWINLHLGFNLIDSRPPQPDHGAPFPPGRARPSSVVLRSRPSRIRAGSTEPSRGGRGRHSQGIEPEPAGCIKLLGAWSSLPLAGAASTRPRSKPQCRCARPGLFARPRRHGLAPEHAGAFRRSDRGLPNCTRDRSNFLVGKSLAWFRTTGEEGVPRVAGRFRDGEEIRPQQPRAGERDWLYDRGTKWSGWLDRLLAPGDGAQSQGLEVSPLPRGCARKKGASR